MPTTNFKNLAAELKAMQQKLATSTYAAVFAYSSETRAKAAAEASVLDKQMQELLNGAVIDAHELSQLTRINHAVTPLDAASELIRQLEIAGYSPRDEANQPMSPSQDYGAKMGSGSMASVDLAAMVPCSANCASVRAAASI